MDDGPLSLSSLSPGLHVQKDPPHVRSSRSDATVAFAQIINELCRHRRPAFPPRSAPTSGSPTTWFSCSRGATRSTRPRSAGCRGRRRGCSSRPSPSCRCPPSPSCPWAAAARLRRRGRRLRHRLRALRRGGGGRLGGGGALRRGLRGGRRLRGGLRRGLRRRFRGRRRWDRRGELLLQRLGCPSSHLRTSALQYGSSPFADAKKFFTIAGMIERGEERARARRAEGVHK